MQKEEQLSHQQNSNHNKDNHQQRITSPKINYQNLQQSQQQQKQDKINLQQYQQQLINNGVSKLKLQLESNQHQPTAKEFNTSRNYSKLLMNYFSSNNNNQDSIMQSPSQSQNYLTIQKGNKTIQKTIQNNDYSQSTVQPPVYSIIHNIFSENKNKTQDSLIMNNTLQQSNNQMNKKENQSISSRLNNLKQFYNSKGPTIDKDIVPKTSYQKHRTSNSQTNFNNRKSSNYSYDNLDRNITQQQMQIQVNQGTEDYINQQKQQQQQLQQYFSSPSSAINKTPVNYLFTKSSNHSKRTSFNDAIFHYNNINFENNNNNNLNKDQNNLLNPQSNTHKKSFSLIQQTDRYINNNGQSIQKLQVPIINSSIHSSPRQLSLQKQGQSQDQGSNQRMNQSQKKQENISKENYFKQQQQNLFENTCKKFIICSQYEAHHSYKSDQNQAEKVYLQQLDSIHPQLKQISLHINTALASLKDNIKTDSQLTSINNIALASKNGYIQVVCLLLQAKICFEYRDYVKCIHLAKKSKDIAQTYGYNYEKMKNYELIGNAFNALQKHKISIIYQIKVLRLSWLIGNKNMELKAYDQLGKCYYYLGDLQKAQYYHQKTMTGEVEKDQAIKQLSNSKLLNREYKSNLGMKKKNDKRKKFGMIENDIDEDEEEFVSSSDDEFEITVSIKIPLQDNNNYISQDKTYKEDGNLKQSNDNEYNINGSKKNNSCSSLAWNDKLIMARLKVLQIQRTKEMKTLSKNKSLAINNAADEIGKVELKMNLKNQEYLEKILQKRGKATKMQKKYRISHLTPNRSILSYHEAESQFLKNKNYSSQFDFIPTIDVSNLKKIQQILQKYKSFLLETIQVIPNILLNSVMFQNMESSHIKNNNNNDEQQNIPQRLSNNYIYDENDFKFKKMQEKENNRYLQ